VPHIELHSTRNIYPIAQDKRREVSGVEDMVKRRRMAPTGHGEEEERQVVDDPAAVHLPEYMDNAAGRWASRIHDGDELTEPPLQSQHPLSTSGRAVTRNDLDEMTSLDISQELPHRP
jgi:hypothetical protein